MNPTGTARAARSTPLASLHRSSGAVMVEFAGWEMPQQFSSIRDEVLATRAAAGIFDVSHMGEVSVSGSGALQFLRRALTNDAALLRPGRAQYSLLCTDAGGIVDDLLVYRLGEEEFLLIVNASRVETDLARLEELAGGENVHVTDQSDEWSLIAFQGPRAAAYLQQLSDADLGAWRRNSTGMASIAGVACRVSRTGYTGEDGFELLCAPGSAERLWEALAACGEGVRPCGLGARDVLRLEAGLRLYGQDMDESTSPYAASLAWVVKLEREDFAGRDALLRLSATERRRTVGLLPEGSGSIARHGARVSVGGVPAGEVTSGTFSFTLERPIATAILELPPTGARVEVEVRGRPVPAGVTSLPFVGP